MEKTPLAVQLGQFVAALRFEDLPPAVVDKAKAVVNHAVTVAMAGFGTARAEAARHAVLQQESLGARRVGTGQGATVWVDGTRATRVGAVFANGVAMAVNNQCDSYHMLTHPGVLIVPAGLATAEGEGRTGRELLTALVAGYEVQCRCARDFIPAFTGSQRGDLTCFTGPLQANRDDVVADLGRRWEILDVKFKIYPTPGFNQPVVWLTSEMAARHKLRAEEIERIALEMNYLETLYPSPRFPRPPAPDGSGFGRTAYMLAYTVVAGDYPVLEKNVEDPRDAGAAADGELAGRVAALQQRVEILGVVGRECFAPRMTFTLRDGRRVTGEYRGRELMWDFARDARELRRFLPGLPVAPARYDTLVEAIAHLDSAASVDEMLALTLPG